MVCCAVRSIRQMTLRALRALARHREMLVSYQAAHIQHMQKALELMNLKLTLC